MVNIVKKLTASHEVLPADIGIVTPYAAQVRAIRKLLRGNAPERSRHDGPPAPDSMQALEVSTVDGFQVRRSESSTLVPGLSVVRFVVEKVLHISVWAPVRCSAYYRVLLTDQALA